MRIKAGLIVLASFTSIVGCKTTQSSSRVSAEERPLFKLDFEDRPSYYDPKEIVLTFDDGPDWGGNTLSILDTLKREGIKGSFFINMDNWMDLNNPTAEGILRRIRDEGHELASHTTKHNHIADLPSEAEVVNNIRPLQDKVKQITGHTMTLLRMPHGEPFQVGHANYDRVARVVARYGLHIGWNLDSFDYLCKDAGCVVSNTMKEIDRGKYGMLLLHSVHAHTAQALPQIISELRGRGFRFALVEDGVKRKFGKTSQEIMGGGVTRPEEPKNPDGPNVSQDCKSPAWVAGTFYRVGQKVVYQGRVYTAQNADNPGYDPIISHWFWLAGEVCSK